MWILVQFFLKIIRAYFQQHLTTAELILKRVKRGLYQTQHGLLVNADINGAANILKKVATTLGFSLKGVGRGTLTMPLRVQFWTA
ncbi:MAG: hypothetical protein ACP5D7_11655 [Limnospira sp.]